jgi:hypothetical protein
MDSPTPSETDHFDEGFDWDELMNFNYTTPLDSQEGEDKLATAMRIAQIDISEYEFTTTTAIKVAQTMSWDGIVDYELD